MTRLLYIFGLTNIAWGLFCVTPIFLAPSKKEIPIIGCVSLLFIFTGISVVRRKTFSWTLNILIGLMVVLTMTISTVNELIRKTDLVVHYAMGHIIILTVGLMLTLFSLFSILRTFGSDVISIMSVSRMQIGVTLAVGVCVAIIWSTYLLRTTYLI